MRLIDYLCIEVENIYLKARVKQLEKRLAKLTEKKDADANGEQ